MIQVKKCTKCGFAFDAFGDAMPDEILDAAFGEGGNGDDVVLDTVTGTTIGGHRAKCDGVFRVPPDAPVCICEEVFKQDINLYRRLLNPRCPAHTKTPGLRSV